jgi:uncharacterized membrane protein YkoI
MNTTQVRSKLKQYIDKLSPEKLTIVADFFRDLEEEETEQIMDATEELLNISSFESAFEKANQEVKEGKVKDWRLIRNDV